MSRTKILPWVLLVLAITCSAAASVMLVATFLLSIEWMGDWAIGLTAASWVLAIAASCVRFE